MDELISKEMARRIIDSPRNKEQILRMLESIPSAETQRMRAKWIATTSLQKGQITYRDYKCSNCSHHRGKPMNYCEVCGAKMEGIEDG